MSVRFWKLLSLWLAMSLLCACNSVITNPAPATGILSSSVPTTLTTAPDPPVPGTSTVAVLSTPVANAAPSEKAYFTVAVIVDTTSEAVSRGQAQSVIDDANKTFTKLTPFGFALTDFVTDSQGGSTTEMVNRYIQLHSASLPNGIIIFSYGDNTQAKLSGGYSYSVPSPGGYRNQFVSPIVGADKIYVAVVDFGYRYAACGYGGGDVVKSHVSIGAECASHPRTPCVQHNGYSMCSNDVGDMYSSTSTYFAASTVIHQLMHSFSAGGDKDHYATPQCNAKMGWPQGFYDNIEAEFHNGLCPFVYDDFAKSYQP